MKWHIIESNEFYMSPYKCVATYKTEEEAKQDLAKRPKDGLDSYQIMNSEQWGRQWYVAHLTEAGRSRRRNRLEKKLGAKPKFMQA